MRKLCTLTLTGLLSASPWALAANWVEFAQSADENATYFLDTSSVKVNGKKRSAWSKSVLVTSQAYNGGLLQSLVALVEVDCDGRTQRTRSEVGFSPDGNTLYQYGENPTPTPVIPDSIGEGRLEAICTHKLKKK